MILHKELDADDEELTRTRKLRRGFVYQKYAPVIEGLYAGADEIPVQSKVRYRDGREAVIETVLQVRRLLPVPGAAPQVEERRAARGRRRWRRMSSGLGFFLNLLVNGIVVGALYALVALGFVLIYKASGVINLAQGELVLLGAYIGLTFTTELNLPFALALLLTIAVATRWWAWPSSGRCSARSSASRPSRSSW